MNLPGRIPNQFAVRTFRLNPATSQFVLSRVKIDGLLGVCEQLIVGFDTVRDISVGENLAS